MNKKLSILICSLEERDMKLQRLMNVLSSQKNNDIEILIKTDSGSMSIGHKRNLLLQEATGEYICFIDDDDLVSNNYVEKVLNATESKPDCCGIKGTITFNGNNTKTFIHSLQYSSWFKKDNIYYRCPNHLNPVKRELALQVNFPEINFGEDKDYSTRLFGLLKTEYMIPENIYYYLYEKSPPANKKNNKNKRINRRVR